MAYVSKELKAELVARVKAVLPADWKVTFGVRHHSTFVITIQQAPVSVLKDITNKVGFCDNHPYVNHYHLESGWTGETLKVLTAIRDAAMSANHDNSDSMTDYFDVGYYLDMGFGKWDKPCRFV